MSHAFVQLHNQYWFLECPWTGLFISLFTFQTIPSSSSRGRTNKPVSKHPCEICSLKFDTDLLLKSHEAMKHFPVRVKFCDMCGLQINPKRGLREHVDQFHPPKEVLENVSILDFKLYKDCIYPVNLNIHYSRYKMRFKHHQTHYLLYSRMISSEILARWV